MKKYTNLVLLGFCVLMSQSNNLFAGSWRLSLASRPKMSATDVENLVAREARRYRIDLQNSFYRDLLNAAAANDSRLLDYEGHTESAGKFYPANVLSAASAISKAVNGEAAQVTRILRAMLYHSD